VPRTPTFTAVVVDSLPLHRQALVNLLTRRLGYNVVASVGTLTEGLRYLRAASPDLAILDLDVPDGDTVGVLPFLACIAPRSCVVLMALAFGTQDLELAGRARVHACVLKTGPIADLERLLRSAVADPPRFDTGLRAQPQPCDLRDRWGRLLAPAARSLTVLAARSKGG